jgi:hypothetical protein
MENLVIIVICSLVCFLLKRVDPDKDIERFYYKTNRPVYYIHFFAYKIIIFALMLNIKYLLANFFKGFNIRKYFK